MARRARALVVLLAVVSLHGCADAGRTDGGDGTWVGTTTTEGNVTTVVNESGSVWGEAARLVEEVSIGVDVGDDPYMFGEVQSLAVQSREVGDDRIYVLDSQVPVVRVFDASGTHLLDIGRQGQGPGEFESPVFLGVDGEGRVYVHDGGETEVFSSAGDPVDTLATHFAYRPGPQAPEISVSPGGELFIPRTAERDVEGPWRASVEIAEHGGGAARGGGAERGVRPLPELGHEPVRITAVFRGRGFESISGFPPPFVPELVWTIGRRGEIVVGRADRYEFERHGVDGSIERVSRYWEPTPLEPGERDWYLRRSRGFLRRAAELRGEDLDTAMPFHKPAFVRLFAGVEGRTWALRQVGAERIDGCNESATSPAEFNDSPCWRDVWSLDVFDTDGRYLGAVAVPPGASFIDPEEPRPAIRGDLLVTAAENEAGTIMVKRYRLVPPGEERAR